MLDIFQPSAVFTNTWFIRKRVGWAVWPAGEIMNVIGTYSCTTPGCNSITLSSSVLGSRDQVP